VQGKTKGGLGGAVVGGVLLGPAGAVVGAVASRKTTVKTDVQKVDTRQFELELTGPGFSWSTVQGPAGEASLKKFRDVINARGSSTQDVQALASAQAAHVAALQADSSQAAVACESAASVVNDHAAAYDEIWANYAAARLPLGHEFRGRWESSGAAAKTAFAFVGPIMILAILVWLVVAAAVRSSASLSLGWRVGFVYLVVAVGALAVYVYRVRLLK
jgi:hypothetical protein